MSGQSNLSLNVIEFRALRRAKVLIVFGSLVIVLALVLATSVGVERIGILISASLVLIGLGVYKCSSVYLRFGSDFLETKLASSLGWHSILYDEVTRCELTDKLATVYYRKHGVPADIEPTRVQIPFSELREKDRAPCMEAFRTRLPAVKMA